MKKYNRARNIIWFNPPFSENVETNIGKIFLKLIKKHFPPGSKLSKIFNKNTLKLSYSCMPNIKSIISKHNKALLSKQETPIAEKSCNCRNKEKCPMNGKCLQKAVVYKATVSIDNKKKQYIGLTENTFKTRYGNHRASLMNQTKISTARLSQYYWSLKDAGKCPSIEWDIVQKSSPYACGSRKCDLCLSEKLQIIINREQDLLNKRTEIANKCRHNAKFKLCSVK